MTILCNSATYMHSTTAVHLFEIVCPRCGYFSECGVPRHYRLIFNCPSGECSQLFKLEEPSGMFGEPRLEAV